MDCATLALVIGRKHCFYGNYGIGLDIEGPIFVFKGFILSIHECF